MADSYSHCNLFIVVIKRESKTLGAAISVSSELILSPKPHTGWKQLRSKSESAEHECTPETVRSSGRQRKTRKGSAWYLWAPGAGPRQEYGNLTSCETTLWVRVKRHVTHHCVQTMHRGYVEGYCKKSWKIGREHSTYCGKNLVCDHPVSQYSISLRTCHFWHQDDVIDQCWPVIVVYGSVLHLILDSTWVWYSLLLELKIPTLVWHWNCLLRLRRWEGHSLQVMKTQLETLGEEFKLAGNIWWRESIMLWTWTLRCVGIVRTMIIFGHLICLRVLWWDVSVLWGPYLHHRHRGLWIIHLILWCAFIVPEMTLIISVRTTLFLRRRWSILWIGYYSGRKTSAIQLYFGWPTLTMLNRTFYSPLSLETVRCYLYVENWFGERTLCSDYTLYPEEGCTDTLCESLRSWEVSHKFD